MICDVYIVNSAYVILCGMGRHEPHVLVSFGGGGGGGGLKVVIV